MLSKIKNIDWTIVIILLMFAGICIPVVHSAVSFGSNVKMAGSEKLMAVYYVLGFIAMFVITFVDYRLFVKYALYLYIFGIGVLMLVWTPLSANGLNGANGWIKLLGVSVQPAEVFKLVLIIGIGALLVRKQKEKLRFWKDVVPVGLAALVPFMLVIAQNDLGNALCYAIILAALLWIGNIKYTHVLIFVILAGGLLYGGVTAYRTFHPQIESFMSLHMTEQKHYLKRLDPILLPGASEGAYHQGLAIEAIAGGGMLGKGYMQGEVSPRVPYTYADSIITVVGEEFGFVGMAALLLLYFIMIHRMIIIALECRDRAGPFIIVGIVAMFLYQIFENIGMNIGVMPITGITLPFISYGGTSLLINMASMGIVLSIHVYNQEVMKTEHLLKTDHLDEADREKEAERRKKRGFKLPSLPFGRGGSPRGESK
ncbi:FtsW/RodA/SpoVE family cell cycle protein [Saccharibacillus sp. CPCC 101409]|uniref:FtsW/RodA/SpoVE family cell cycle protein n=1 Tax=Saccharibacillus sp. CPCC 101409 TaxID=3058041 RepID=UPI00267409AB|nr:FtsW/RodA/SpoVE family cell cycle protein [Saccharibacillus sp. CPCC 101409]MDO3412130.1 FtsW/RodA/SpoVE family cell cycle protein [Saccharibacillus sp. CPCC 101409]